jgi:O-succinylbenzoic acid--CoA ligase
VIWTSGTGGRPRGVALSYANLAASIAAARVRLGLGPDDRWLATLGVAHVGGLLLVLRAAATGALLVARGRFLADEAAALVAGGAVSHASLVPTMLRQLVELLGGRPAPALRCLLVGGAACPRPLVERAVTAGLPLALTYGMTEATSQAATAPPDVVRRKPGTVGRPLEGLELRLDESGEILLRGPTIAAGYVGTELPLLDGDGWLRTGDLGEIDGEGDLWVTGRRSDRIVTGGVNVDPVEVEEVLRLHDGVSEAVVVGLPDERWGEVVAAAVVRSGGAYPDPDELEELTRTRLTTSKVPRRWLFLAELPRNANGKVDRDAVRQGFATA